MQLFHRKPALEIKSSWGEGSEHEARLFLDASGKG
jgi:hypothetical protein